MAIQRSLALTLVIAVALPLAACGTDDEDSGCTPGESQGCVGPGGCQGGQACLADGTGYGECNCGGSPRTDGGSSSPPSDSGEWYVCTRIMGNLYASNCDNDAMDPCDTWTEAGPYDSEDACEHDQQAVVDRLTAEGLAGSVQFEPDDLSINSSIVLQEEGGGWVQPQFAGATVYAFPRNGGLTLSLIPAQAPGGTLLPNEGWMQIAVRTTEPPGELTLVPGVVRDTWASPLDLESQQARLFYDLAVYEATGTIYLTTNRYRVDEPDATLDFEVDLEGMTIQAGATRYTASGSIGVTGSAQLTRYGP